MHQLPSTASERFFTTWQAALWTTFGPHPSVRVLDKVRMILILEGGKFFIPFSYCFLCMLLLNSLIFSFTPLGNQLLFQQLYIFILDVSYPSYCLCFYFLTGPRLIEEKRCHKQFQRKELFPPLSLQKYHTHTHTPANQPTNQRPLRITSFIYSLCCSPSFPESKPEASLMRILSQWVQSQEPGGKDRVIKARKEGRRETLPVMA